MPESNALLQSPSVVDDLMSAASLALVALALGWTIFSTSPGAIGAHLPKLSRVACASPIKPGAMCGLTSGK